MSESSENNAKSRTLVSNTSIGKVQFGSANILFPNQSIWPSVSKIFFSH